MKKVFLGDTCNGSTWRDGLIKELRINYFEPCAEEWTPATCFDKDIIWHRPGAPDIPFSGTFKGIEEVMKMFGIQASVISIKEFIPEKICANDDMVAVFGHDHVNVNSTGKIYSTGWVQSYTFKNGKIIYVEVYMDTKVVADAFTP